MLSLQEISDRLEIEEILIDYANLIDSGDFDALDRLFTPDAHIDHSANGSFVGYFPEFKQHLKTALPKFPNYQHLMGNFQIKVTDDIAVARCLCLNPMEMALADGGRQVMFIGMWYDSELVRLADGWRLRKRVQQACFRHNAPPSPQMPRR